MTSSIAQLEALARVRIMAANGDLWRLCKQAGLSQREIARAVGVTSPTVWSWMHGRMRPTGEPALKLAELAQRLQAITADGTEPAA
jgi:transcriptional regulator with XRE-family HTH domain